MKKGGVASLPHNQAILASDLQLGAELLRFG
jgi:hypothetical protein